MGAKVFILFSGSARLTLYKSYIFPGQKRKYFPHNVISPIRKAARRTYILP